MPGSTHPTHVCTYVHLWDAVMSLSDKLQVMQIEFEQMLDKLDASMLGQISTSAAATIAEVSAS